MRERERDREREREREREQEGGGGGDEVRPRETQMSQPKIYRGSKRRRAPRLRIPDS